MNPTQICIVGTGIAAQTLAAALASSPIRVITLHSEPDSTWHGGLWLPQHTLLSLAQIGVTPRYTPHNQVVFTNASGSRARPKPTPGGGLSAAELQRALIAAARVERTILGTIQQLHRSATQIDVQTESEVLTVKWLIGADGVTSSARRFVDPELLAADTGMWVHRARSDFYTGLRQPYVFTAGKTRVEFTPLPHKTTAYTIVCRSKDPRAVEDFSGPIPAAIAATPAERWRSMPLHDLPSIHLGNERIALIGDAAHGPTHSPTLGAQLAIEDALFLAQCLVGGSTARYREQRHIELQRYLRRSSFLPKRWGTLSGDLFPALFGTEAPR